MDDADWLLDVRAKLAGEIETGGGKRFHGGGSGEHPRALHIINWLGLGRTCDGKDAQAGVGRAGLCFVDGGGIAYGPLHVRLAGADPDFADNDVMSGEDFLSRADHEILTLLRGLQAGERGAPLAIVAGRGRGFG